MFKVASACVGARGADRLRGACNFRVRVLPSGRPRVARMVPGLGGFWALIATQFQGVFSDNALKWLVSFLVLETAASKEQRDLWFVLIVPLLFSVPFLLFSIPGGFLADRFSKRT